MSEPEYDEETDSWSDYSSQFMFGGDGPECTCGHEPVEHDYSSCAVDGCPCEAFWEHT